MNEIESLRVVDVPDRVLIPSVDSSSAWNRRMSAYLARRAAGGSGLNSGTSPTLVCRPFTDEERRAREARLKGRVPHKKEPAYKFFRSTAEAYRVPDASTPPPAAIAPAKPDPVAPAAPVIRRSTRRRPGRRRGRPQQRLDLNRDLGPMIANWLGLR